MWMRNLLGRYSGIINTNSAKQTKRSEAILKSVEKYDTVTIVMPLSRIINKYFKILQPKSYLEYFLI